MISAGAEMQASLIDQHTVSLVAAAIEQGHKMTPCASCGGPEVHSKRRAAAKCFQCLAYRETAFVVRQAFRRRCRRCRRLFKTTVEYLTCEGCRGRLREPEDAPKTIRKCA